MIDGPSIEAFGAGDELDLFRAFSAVVEEGGGYPQEPPTTREEFRSIWIDAPVAVRVARLGGDFAGAYYLKPTSRAARRTSPMPATWSTPIFADAGSARRSYSTRSRKGPGTASAR